MWSKSSFINLALKSPVDDSRTVFPSNLLSVEVILPSDTSTPESFIKHLVKSTSPEDNFIFNSLECKSSTLIFPDNKSIFVFFNSAPSGTYIVILFLTSFYF